VFCLLAVVLYALAARTYRADLKSAEGDVPAPNRKLEAEGA